MNGITSLVKRYFPLSLYYCYINPTGITLLKISNKNVQETHRKYNAIQNVSTICIFFNYLYIMIVISCRNFSFSFSRYNICQTLIENVNKRRPFYWLHMNYIDWKQPYMCTRGNILMGILRFLRPLDFLQTTCSDAFARSILRIGFLE